MLDISQFVHHHLAVYIGIQRQLGNSAERLDFLQNRPDDGTDSDEE